MIGGAYGDGRLFPWARDQLVVISHLDASIIAVDSADVSLTSILSPDQGCNLKRIESRVYQ